MADREGAEPGWQVVGSLRVWDAECPLRIDREACVLLDTREAQHEPVVFQGGHEAPPATNCRRGLRGRCAGPRGPAWI
jgi:hypothetical protein